MLQSAPTQSKPFFTPLWMVCLLSVALLSLTACQTQPKSSGKVLEGEGYTLRYSSKFTLGEDVAAMNLQHPLNISEEELVRQMWSLKYKTNSLIGEPAHVFTKEDILKVKRVLAKAFSKVHFGNIIGFQIESDQGDTEGTVFANAHRLYWKFDKIQGVAYNLTRNFNARYGTSWHLLPQENQTLFVSSKLLGSKSWDNWILVKLETENPVTQKRVKQKPVTVQKQPNGSQKPTPENNTTPTPIAPTGETTTNPPSLNPELEKKLEFLKSLRERKLIGEEEYLQKRKELLDSYF